MNWGYRVVDTAQIYENEADVGQAIADSGVARTPLYITSKIWVDNFSQDRLIPSLKESLEETAHRPFGPDPDSLAVSSGRRSGCRVHGRTAGASRGLTKEIGVSNFTIALMKEAIDAVDAEHIATNQIELHPYLQNRKVAEFAKSQGIHITSYMTLAYGEVLKDPVIQRIAQQHNATPAQVTLAWAMQLGYSVIPSSTQRANLGDNLKACIETD